MNDPCSFIKCAVYNEDLPSPSFNFVKKSNFLCYYDDNNCHCQCNTVKLEFSKN